MKLLFDKSLSPKLVTLLQDLFPESGAKVVILRRCDDPTDVAAKVLRRNSIRVAKLPRSESRLLILDR